MASETKPMTPQEFEATMREIVSLGDSEAGRSLADGLMCGVLATLGYEKGAAIYVEMMRRLYP